MNRAYLFGWTALALLAVVLLVALATSRAATPDPDTVRVSAASGSPLGAPQEVVVSVERSSLGGSDLLSGSGAPMWCRAGTCPRGYRVAPELALSDTITGLAGWAVPSLGPSYLAMRLPRGTPVTISGPGGAWTTRVTDYGPSSRIRPSRIADIAEGQWQRVCGLPASAGLCRVSVTTGALPLAPSTDLEADHA